MTRRLLVLSALAALAAGCATGPNYQRPALEVPAHWRTLEASTNSPDGLEWTAFYRDPVLTNLVTTALLNNQDLQAAAARVEQALGAYRITRAALFPSVNAQGAYEKQRAGDLIPLLSGRETEEYDLFGLLSYEVDLWGRVRRQKEAAFAQALASEESRQTVELGLVSGVIQGYFNLRALDRELEIACETLVSRTNSLAITKTKFAAGQGIVSELDVAQAETQVASTESAIANLQRQVVLAEDALSLLLGVSPREIARGTPLMEQELPLDIPAGLPSGLLLRRPDVRAAEQLLVAANANIGAARAAYFPVISLTGALGLQSRDLDNLFDTSVSKAWTFQPSVTTPIFQGGRIRAGVKVAEAQRKEAVANYGKAVQTAFRETDDALANIKWLREQLRADDAVVAAEQKRLDLSALRYEGGVSSYSDVLDAQRFLFNAQLTAVQTRAALLNATVQLYKALGGGWSAPAALR